MRNISMITNSTTRGILDDIRRESFCSLGDELKEIVLYGSYARNDQDQDSDIDIVAFVDCESIRLPEIRKKISEIKVDLSLKYDVVISIIIKNYRHYLNYREKVPFYSTIYNEGIPIHA